MDSIINARMDSINQQNRERALCNDVAASVAGANSGGDWQQLVRFLPFAFTGVCPFCGKMGVHADGKNMMPLRFLAKFLRYACAPTPYVWNILWQMVTAPAAVEEEAARVWSEMVGIQTESVNNGVPESLRRRVCMCLACAQWVSRRAYQRRERGGETKGGEDDDEEEEMADDENVKMEEGGGGGVVTDHWMDQWEFGALGSHNGMMESVTMNSSGEIKDKEYKGESKRNIRKNLMVILPIDKIIINAHAPTEALKDEYRTAARLLNLMAGVYPPGCSSLYASIPSIQLSTLLMEIRSRSRLPQRSKCRKNTIWNLSIMSWYMSTGQRKFVRSNDKLGSIVRWCAAKKIKLSTGAGPSDKWQDVPWTNADYEAQKLEDNMWETEIRLLDNEATPFTVETSHEAATVQQKAPEEVKQQALCSYAKCSMAANSVQTFTCIKEGTVAGGQDWSRLTGLVLCHRCYHRFRYAGILDRRVSKRMQRIAAEAAAFADGT